MLRQICNDNCCSLFAEYHLIYNIIDIQKGYTLRKVSSCDGNIFNLVCRCPFYFLTVFLFPIRQL